MFESYYRSRLNYAHDYEEYLKLAKDVSNLKSNSAEEVKRGAEIDRLYLIVESLWKLLKEKHGLTDEDLLQRIVEVDLEDGKMDARKKSPPSKCKRCHKTLMKNKIYCAYCGELHPPEPFVR